MSQSRTVINRGKRTLTLKPASDGTARILEPGKSIECLDEAEFKHLTRYHDIVDADKAVPELAKKQADLQEQLRAAHAENERLKEESKKHAPVEQEEDDSDDESKKSPGPKTRVHHRHKVKVK